VVNIAREDITEQSSVKEFFTTKGKPYQSYNHVSKTGSTEKKKKEICGHGDVKQVM
jgi:arsenate reductase-like glutaredoxin family protein